MVIGPMSNLTCSCLIASRTVADCSERRHFSTNSPTNAHRFLIAAVVFMLPFARLRSDLSVIKPTSRRDGVLSVTAQI